MHNMEKILVCLKQVPKTKDVKINPENHTLIREGVESIINPYDDYALEEALLLKKKYGVTVATMTMGPPQAEGMLQYSLRRGADEAYLLSDKGLAGSDTWATAIAIAGLIKKINCRNVFCGQESIDSGTGHIGASLAELLNIPQMNYVKKVLGLSNGRLKVLAKFDGADAQIDGALPLVVSFLKKNTDLKLRVGKDQPIPAVQKVNLKDLRVPASHVGLEGSFTQVVNIDIDERFVGYVNVDSQLSADDRILYITSGGIQENTNRKVIKDMSDEAVLEIAGLIR